ncbi:MAG TPA: trehalose-6-phosphate synthase [Candidatus Limnocylindrales bacterium]|nr:trehalose-6-phosphate synthase [Candidatus Limnocylindrales bacterium]
MKLSLRLILSLVVGITLVTFLIARNQVRSEKRGLRADLVRRAEIFAESLQEIVEPALERGSREQLRRIVDRFGNREGLAGVVVYDDAGHILAESASLVTRFSPPPPPKHFDGPEQGVSQFLNLNNQQMHAYYLPVPVDSPKRADAVLAVFHDASYIEAQSERIWRDTLWHVIAQVLLVVFVTILIIRWTIVLPISRTAQWMKDLRTGRVVSRPPPLPAEDFLAPFSQEVMNLTKSLSEARAAAEEEARLRDTGVSRWTAERLRVSVQNKLGGPLFVVSNREPCMHVYRGKNIESVVPASGLVTALEPILRACDGTWIAFGSGDADRATVDNHDRLRVPVDNPEYTLRRVWLSKEMEQGYYYGFSNEGLWPLCHIAHTRPVFRASDWQAYQDANRLFADAVLDELGSAEHALLLVQDYHFALLPRMVKQIRPDVRVAIFWHIPWPNPEAFGICPWQRELLDGLLGADIVGFQTQAHCNNFLETVDAALESRIEWERFAVKRHGHSTFVRPFPISVDFRDSQPTAELADSPYRVRAGLLEKLGIKASFLGIGVDRVDYTKGIIERLRGIERFLEKNPSYVGKFAFVQIGAPSRTHIQRYQDFLNEVQVEADRINTRFQTADWRPIALLLRHHAHSEILPYYRAADLCLVTSLHDGMNLVCKEFVATRDDEEGALILSQFTGASRELRDAIIVNPYDADQLAEAIRTALEMDAHERSTRMQRMRRIVREHNVYHWAGTLISDLSEIRLEEPQPEVLPLTQESVSS